MRLRGDFELPMASFYARNALAAFCKASAVFFFVAPKMECVGENYVAEQIVVRTIVDV